MEGHQMLKNSDTNLIDKIQVAFRGSDHVISPKEIAATGVVVKGMVRLMVCDDGLHPDLAGQVCDLTYYDHDSIGSTWGFYRTSIENGASLLLLDAQDPLRVIGHASLEIDIDDGDHSLHVNTIFIAAGHRGKGNGKALAAGICAMVSRVNRQLYPVGPNPEWRVYADTETASAARIIQIIDDAVEATAENTAPAP